MGQGWDEETVAQLLMDPFTTITVAPQMTVEHDPAMSTDEWVLANTALIQEMGAQVWLTQLLNALEGKKVTDERVHPFNVVNIDPRFAAGHEPIIPTHTWIGANSRLITEELGVKKWLTQFLDILEGDIVTSSEFGPDVPYGYRPAGYQPQHMYSFSQGGKRRNKKKKHKR
jgi:hypothetical protein